MIVGKHAAASSWPHAQTRSTAWITAESPQTLTRSAAMAMPWVRLVTVLA
jgi:hypothetical protein